MRTFRAHPAFQEYIHPHKEKILKYMELMYGIGSELNRIDNLQERKIAACNKAGLEIPDMQTILDEKDEEFQALRHVYLSHYQFHNKFQSLMTFQQLLWNAHKESMTPGNDFEVAKLDKLVDFIDKLEGKCARLFSEIYGSNEIIDIAKEEIKKTRSPEEKLKELK